MLLESGPALKDRLYNTIFMIALVAYAGWCYYDGTYRYFDLNRAEAKKTLTPLVGEGNIPATLGRAITRDTQTFLRTRIPALDSPRAIQDALAVAPIHEKRSADGQLEAQYYVSDFGMITVPVTHDSVDPAKIEFQKWKYEPLDLTMQFGMMYLVLVVAALFGWRALNGTLLRATIDEQELRYGKKRIPIKSIKRLSDYSPKGLVTLVFEDAAGRLQKLRLDDQKILKFQEIIDVICNLRGFADPRKKADADPEDESATAESDDAEAKP